MDRFGLGGGCRTGSDRSAGPSAADLLAMLAVEPNREVARAVGSRLQLDLGSVPFGPARPEASSGPRFDFKTRARSQGLWEEPNTLEIGLVCRK